MRKNSKNLIFITVTFLFVLVFGVLIDFMAGRIYIPADAFIRASSSYYHHDLRPNTSKKLHWFTEPEFTMHTNSLGFKDSKVRHVDLKASKYRILFMGDSFTEGVGLPYEQTFPGLVDEMLPGDRFEVLNGAVISYTPKLYYLKIKRLMEKGLEFNELFLFIDISDIQDELTYEFYKPHKPGVYMRLWHFLSQNSYVFRLVYTPPKFIPDEARWPPPKYNWKPENRTIERWKWATDKEVYDRWGHHGMALAGQNIDKILALCKDKNIKLNLAVYPWRELVTKRAIDSVQVAFWEKFSKERNIQFYNYFPDFINEVASGEVIKKYFYSTDIHWNKEGHKLIASRIIPAILEGPEKTNFPDKE